MDGNYLHALAKIAFYFLLWIFTSPSVALSLDTLQATENKVRLWRSGRHIVDQVSNGQLSDFFQEVPDGSSVGEEKSWSYFFYCGSSFDSLAGLDSWKLEGILGIPPGSRDRRFEGAAPLDAQDYLYNEFAIDSGDVKCNQTGSPHIWFSFYPGRTDYRPEYHGRHWRYFPNIFLGAFGLPLILQDSDTLSGRGSSNNKNRIIPPTLLASAAPIPFSVPGKKKQDPCDVCRDNKELKEKAESMVYRAEHEIKPPPGTSKKTPEQLIEEGQREIGSLRETCEKGKVSLEELQVKTNLRQKYEKELNRLREDRNRITERLNTEEQICAEWEEELKKLKSREKDARAELELLKEAIANNRQQVTKSEQRKRELANRTCNTNFGYQELVRNIKYAKFRLSDMQSERLNRLAGIQRLYKQYDTLEKLDIHIEKQKEIIADFENRLAECDEYKELDRKLDSLNEEHQRYITRSNAVEEELAGMEQKYEEIDQALAACKLKKLELARRLSAIELEIRRTEAHLDFLPAMADLNSQKEKLEKETTAACKKSKQIEANLPLTFNQAADIGTSLINKVCKNKNSKGKSLITVKDFCQILKEIDKMNISEINKYRAWNALVKSIQDPGNAGKWEISGHGGKKEHSSGASAAGIKDFLRHILIPVPIAGPEGLTEIEWASTYRDGYHFPETLDDERLGYCKEYWDTIKGKRSTLTYLLQGLLISSDQGLTGDEALHLAMCMMMDVKDANATKEWVSIFQATYHESLRTGKITPFKVFAEKWCAAFVAPEGQGYVDSRISN